MIQHSRCSRAPSSRANVAGSSATLAPSIAASESSRTVARLSLRLQPARASRPRLRAGADAEGIVDAGVLNQRRAHVRTNVQAHRARPMPRLPLCLRRWRRGDTQAAVRAAAKRARGCSSAKRTHLHTATAASLTVATHCARSVRSAPSEARAASASRSSMPDGFFLRTARGANASSMNQQRRQAAAKPRAMRKRWRFESPSNAAAPAANALTAQRTSCSSSATFSCHCRLRQSQWQRCDTGQRAKPMWLRRVPTL